MFKISTHFNATQTRKNKLKFQRALTHKIKILTRPNAQDKTQA